MNKIYKNEKMFEAANTRMTQATSSLAPAGLPKDFILELYCECANKLCEERIGISYEKYNQAKIVENFVIKPEHYLPEFERLIDKTARYWTVAKRPEKLDKEFEV